MHEVKSVQVQIESPNKDRGFAGRTTMGYYRLSDGVMTMTDGAGNAMRWNGSGDEIKHTMRPGDKEEHIAHWLTGRVYRMLRGEDQPGGAKGFGRTLVYPESGVA